MSFLAKLKQWFAARPKSAMKRVDITKRFDLMNTFRVPDPLPPPPIPANPGPPGSIVRDDQGAVAFPGALEDWQHLLDTGHRITAMGNSDSHHLVDGEGGYPRNLIDLGHAWSGAAPTAFVARRGAFRTAFRARYLAPARG